MPYLNDMEYDSFLDRAYKQGYDEGVEDGQYNFYKSHSSDWLQEQDEHIPFLATYFRCSSCNHIADYPYNFCPHCGREMA